VNPAPDKPRARVPVYGAQLPLPKHASNARRETTWRHLQNFAKDLRCEPQFQQDQNRPDYPAAFANYHHALWRWVWSLTPPDVRHKLNQVRFRLPDTLENEAADCVAKHEYMLWRAVFVAGMKVGEGFKANHYRRFAQLAHVADRLDDEALFEIARQHRHGRTPKTGHDTARRLKYALIVAWLAGGLWRMPSRDDQAAAIYRWWAARPSPEAIHKAQTRLGLEWLPSRTN
jgi:hypothetical protein